MTVSTMTDRPMHDKPATDPSARFWDRHARKYATNKIGDMAGYEKTLARTQEFLRPDQDVLEIGCGTGTTALHHAPHVSHITGTDISSQMVAIATEKTADSNLLNAEFITAGADDLPFANGAFDVVMSHNLYHLVDDLAASLKAARRVLKKDGLFITKTPCLKDMNPLMRYGLLPVMKLIFRVPFLGVFSSDEIQTAIADAEFEITHVEFHATKGKDTRPFIVARAI